MRATMELLERAGLLAHAQTVGFRKRLAQTQRTIDNALEVMQRPSVSFSGGKDSSVVLHLVRQVAPETVATYADDEWILPETEALLRATPNLVRVARRLQHAEWFTAYADGPPAALPEGAVWTEGSRWQYVRDVLGCDGVFLGLRADENNRRRTYLRSRGLLVWLDHYQQWHCNPIAWWTTQDVWAYIVSRDVPYNAAYDVMRRLGVPLAEQRIGPFAVERALGRGQLAILKRGWPDLYTAFVARYPDAAQYS